ncbi:MAG: hypothetical protein AB1641_30410 [Thermodesulfobacteriota bacterium]
MRASKRKTSLTASWVAAIAFFLMTGQATAYTLPEIWIGYFHHIDDYVWNGDTVSYSLSIPYENPTLIPVPWFKAYMPVVFSPERVVSVRLTIDDF